MLDRITGSKGGDILYVDGKCDDPADANDVPSPPPATRAASVWRVQNDAARSRLLCRVTPAEGGAIGPTAAFPPTMRAFGGGRWAADKDGIALRAPTGGANRLAWEDDVDLNGDDLHLGFVRERRT